MNEKIPIWLIGSLLLFWARMADWMVIRGAYFRQLVAANRVRQETIVAPRGNILTADGFALAENRIICSKVNCGQRILQRYYPLGEAAAHLTGYLGKPNLEELQKGISPQALLGRGGLEQFYQKQLWGKDGRRLVETDAQGRIIRILGEQPPIPGEDIKTTIRADLQKIAWESIRGKKGAAVILNPKTGAILAMVSSPSFDPNIFVEGNNSALIHSWLTSHDYPLLNRAIGGVYHPGSTFKIIVALAGLEEGAITKETLVEDTGVIQIGKWRFANWYWTEYGKKEGFLDVIGALRRSNDIFFYKTGEWLGVDRILSWAKKFGLGKPTGIDLPGEMGGFLPTPEWKKQKKGEPWFLGNTYHLAIGQGDLTVTPLQVGVFTAVVANQGKLCQPYLVEPKGCKSLGIATQNLEIVKRGLIAACSPGGTGFPFFDFHPPVGCKTGTAEVGGKNEAPHAWFTVFAPIEDPQLVVTVLVEQGGSGAHVAAPIAKRILEYYFRH